MFAIVSHKGNQYQVEPDGEYRIDLLDPADKKISFSDVMLVNDDKKDMIGMPFVEGASVDAEVLDIVRGKKVETLKFEAKKRYKRNLGHKQSYSLIKILKINLPNEK